MSLSRSRGGFFLQQPVDAFADEFNTFRLHHTLDGRTLAEYLQSLTAKETPTSHMY